MYITWHGNDCIRLMGKDISVLIDPPTEESGLKVTRLQADILVATKKDSAEVKVSGNPFVIDIAGEYEKSGVFVYGRQWKAKDGAVRVAYLIKMEDISLGVLSAADGDLQTDAQDLIEGADILFLPVGDKDRLSAKQAAEIVNILEPRIVIPVGVKTKGSKMNFDSPDAFFKELGQKPEQTDKLKLTQKDLPTDERAVYELTLS